VQLVSGQFSKEEQQLMQIADAQDSLPRSIFVDPNGIHPMKLSNKSNWRQVWNDVDDEQRGLVQLYDIRLKFENHKEALKFHRDFLELNAENGGRIKKHGIQVSGAEALYVFSGSELMNTMVRDYGYQMYCILFTVDNYFVKMYISCTMASLPKDFQPLVEQAVERIRKQQL
jgi:hypothetical protein